MRWIGWMFFVTGVGACTPFGEESPPPGAAAVGARDENAANEQERDAASASDAATQNPIERDAGADGGQPVGPSDPPAKLIVVQAAHDLGPNDSQQAIRICFATATPADPSNFVVTTVAVLPHTVASGSAASSPGIVVGTGRPLASSGASYERVTVRPYIMNAQALAARGIVGAGGPRCSEVLKPDLDGGALVENRDYWRVDDIPAGTLKDGRSYILLLAGCAADAGDGTRCGNGFVRTGRGNLRATVLELDARTPVAANAIGAQFIHASSAYQSFVDAREAAGEIDTMAMTPVLFNQRGTAVVAEGDFHALTSGSIAYAPGAVKISPLVQVTGIAPAEATVSATKNGPGADGQAFSPMRLNASAAGSDSSVQLLTVGTAAGGDTYVNGKAYTFVAVGDTENATPATKKGHILAFPNVFDVPVLP